MLLGWAPDGFVLLLVLRVRGPCCDRLMQNALVLIARSQESLFPAVLKEKATCTVLMDTDSYHCSFPPRVTAAHRSCANPDSDSAAASSAQNTTEPTNRLGQMLFFVVVCGRRQQQRNVGFGRGWPRRCRVAVAISSTSMQGSALLFLTGPQSRDCVRNWKAGDAAKKSECFICEEPTSKAA